MRSDDDGHPLVGGSARTLGPRPDGSDIDADEDGMVHPYTGGISVGLAPEYLPEHRRPAKFGGTGHDPLWMIQSDDLGAGLRYREDEELAGHGFIEPTWEMSYAEYEERLAATREGWRPA